jgi:hypothetical protein
MKNLLIVSITALLYTMIFTSCKKDTVTNTVTVKDTVAPVRNIIGYWQGQFAAYTTPQQYPTNGALGFLFRANGTVRVYDGTVPMDTATAVVAEGTYNISGLTVFTTFTISAVSLSTVATVDSAFTFFQGTLGNSPSTSGEDVFFEGKQQ